jgi:alkylated DNA repair dioxygenase AlkB
MHLSLESRRKNLGGGSWIAYATGWMEPDAATALQEVLTAQVAWEQRAIRMFGKEIMQPRLIGWGGELPYQYSGQTLPPMPGPAALQPVWDRVSEEVGHAFNHVLLNRYRDGQDAMGFHADDEPELGYEPLIAALSLGVRRKFVLKAKGKNKKQRTVELAHGSLFLMGGNCQHRWYHGVPRQGSVDKERINVTFRLVRGPPGWRAPEEERTEPRRPARAP